MSGAGGGWVNSPPLSRRDWPAPPQHQHGGDGRNAIRGTVMVGYLARTRTVIHVHPAREVAQG